MLDSQQFEVRGSTRIPEAKVIQTSKCLSEVQTYQGLVPCVQTRLVLFQDHHVFVRTTCAVTTAEDQFPLESIHEPGVVQQCYGGLNRVCYARSPY